MLVTADLPVVIVAFASGFGSISRASIKPSKSVIAFRQGVWTQVLRRFSASHERRGRFVWNTAGRQKTGKRWRRLLTIARRPPLSEVECELSHGPNRPPTLAYCDIKLELSEQTVADLG
jgi:hypothetical protein